MQRWSNLKGINKHPYIIRNRLYSSGSIALQFKEVEKKLHIHELEDWYNVAPQHLKFALSNQLKVELKKLGTIESVVRTVYPTHEWDHERFVRTTSRSGKKPLTSQLFLERIVKSLFPNSEIRSNARASHGIVGPSGVPLEIDVFVPELNLGFEYQDPHHYYITSFGMSTLLEYQERDRIKHSKAEKLGITLINVPFWWDWNVDSLISTIKAHRSDLLANVTSSAPVFSVDPPQNIQEKWNYEIPSFGTPMLALYAPRSKTFNPTNWWICEKYDGVRTIWHSEEREFYSRWGSILPLPFYIKDTFSSDIWLDGEIWFGKERGMRYQAIKISQSAPQHVEWSKFQFVAFDMPQRNLMKSPYHKRYSILQSSLRHGHPYIQIPKYDICTDRDFVESVFFRITSEGGEGIILRDPKAPYVHGYSRHLYKHKGFSDAEALVLERLSFKRFLCRVHKLHLSHNNQKNEKLEKLGDSDYYDVEMAIDEDRFDGDVNDIEPQTYVSFRYYGQHSGLGVPIDPKIYTIRSDITSWEQLLHSKRKPPDPPPVWKQQIHNNDWKDTANHKKIFDLYAKTHSFDPLVAANWYQVELKHLKHAQGLIVHHYGGSHIKALMTVYPDIELKENQFNRVPRNYWATKSNRKQFFDSLAAAKGFNPLLPQNWYRLSTEEVTNKKGGAQLMNYYKGYLSSALVDLYPDIGLLQLHFKRHEWSDRKSRKKYFDDVAASRNFDPLVSDNWYSISYDQLMKVKGGIETLDFYDNSVLKGLVDVYHHKDLKRDKFVFLPRNRYTSDLFRKSFFDKYASSRGFDPLFSNNWYSIDPEDIANIKDGMNVLGFHSNSVVSALCSLYPDIGLQQDKFACNIKKRNTR